MIPKPLFRWAGAKTKMRSKYGDDFWPTDSFNRFVEPFFGTGAVSFWIYERFPETEFFVNDKNDAIIDIYKTIKSDADVFIERVEAWQDQYLSKSKPDRKEFYYAERQRHAYDEIETQERSALLFCLLKTSFNGFWQTNQNTNNKFGTPCGLLNEKDKIFDRELIKRFERFSQNAQFFSTDFADMKKHVDDQSFLFLDPPYRDSHTKYTEDGFSDDDQTRMCVMMNGCHDIGASVSMANKYHFDNFFESNLSEAFETITFDVKYTAGRGAVDGEKVAVTECLIRNYGVEKINIFDFSTK